MSSFVFQGVTIPEWAWWVPIAAVVLPRLFRWSVILVAYVLHLINRKDGEVFEFEAKRFGFRLRHGKLPPEKDANATPNEDKTLPSSEDEVPSLKKNEDRGDPTPAGEAPS